MKKLRFSIGPLDVIPPGAKIKLTEQDVYNDPTVCVGLESLVDFRRPEVKLELMKMVSDLGQYARETADLVSVLTPGMDMDSICKAQTGLELPKLWVPGKDKPISVLELPPDPRDETLRFVMLQYNNVASIFNGIPGRIGAESAVSDPTLIDANRTPDLTSPIHAFRSWTWNGEDKIYPRVMLSEEGEPDNSWTPGTNTATCTNGCATPPGKNCGCGFYANKEDLSLAESRSYGEIYGEVLLWGRVMRHAQGYRAQYAKPIRFISLYWLESTTSKNKANFARMVKRYGVTAENFQVTIEIPARTETEVWNL